MIYIIAARREDRDQVSDDWPTLLAGIPGVTLLPTIGSRARIEASDEAIAMVRAALGSKYHIEPVIIHKRS